MAGCSTYTFTEREFTENAYELIRISDSIGDTWRLHHFQNGDVEFYLTKQVAVKLHIHKNDEEDSAAFDCEETPELDQDTGTLYPEIRTPDEEGLLCTFDYHIVYSSSYAVPVLYFNVHKKDGHLLSLEDLWNSLPPTHQGCLSENRWSFITQQEHPILHRPFYQLHPCKTATLMALMKECKQPVSDGTKKHIQNMLISWLSTVGPVVHLDVPLQYGIQIQHER